MRPKTQLNRQTAVPGVIGDPSDFLIIAGLSGSAQDIGAMTNGASNAYILGGAMGAPISMGLGLAVAQPSHNILVVLGDGELLMSAGSLATVAYMNPPNLSILCVDNGCYGETGNQVSATAGSTDLAVMAKGCGISDSLTILTEAEFGKGSRSLRESSGPSFVLLIVSDAPPPDHKRNFDGVEGKIAFRRSCLRFKS